MTKISKNLFLLGILFIVILTFWTFYSFFSSQESFLYWQQSKDEYSLICGYKNEYNKHNITIKASAVEIKTEDLTTRIELASKEAGIDPSHLIRIEPEDARQLPDSYCLEKNTNIEFRNVDYVNLLRFIQLVKGKIENHNIKELRLQSPRDEEYGTKWNVEMTISCRIYSSSPNNPQKAR